MEKREDYFKLYFSKYGFYNKKIIKNTMEQIHNEILNADTDKYDGYMVIEHTGGIKPEAMDNIVAIGRIYPREEIQTPEDLDDLYGRKRIR